MLHAILLLVLAAWGAVGWRFRGGAFTGITKLDPGTEGARILFGGIWMALPLAVVDWRIAAMVAAGNALSLSTTGWGGYMGVYHNGPGTDRRWPYDWILDRLGLPDPSLWRNLIGLGLCGIATASLAALAIGWWAGWERGASLVGFMGLWMPFAYWVTASLAVPLPTGPASHMADDRTSWGEMFVGAGYAPALFLSLVGWGF
jgi:hypothetical protein